MLLRHILAACSLLAFLLTPSLSAQESEGKAQGVVADSGSSSGSKAKVQRKNRDPKEVLQRLKNRSWWNQKEISAAVKLTEDQRAKLDGLLEGAYNSRKAIEQEQAVMVPDFARHLEDGNVEEQLKIVAAMSEGMSRIAAIRANLMVDGVGLLNAEQRKIIGEKFGYIFKKSWFGGGGMGGVETRMQQRKAVRAEREAAGKGSKN